MKIGVYVMGPPNQPHGRHELVVGEPSATTARPTNVAATSAVRELAVRAEELGFDSFWLPDHVVMPVKYTSRYPYQPEIADADLTPYPFDDSPFPEPIAALAYIAGATRRIQLGTGVLVLPERNPVLFAKQAATLDALSEGRLLLGVGLGWLREEYEALGVSWEQRGRRLDEALAAMRALWRDDVASYHGRYVSFDGLRCDPKPHSPQGVRIVIGGHSKAAARRAGRIGDGFMPTGYAGTTDIEPLLDEMRRAAERAGRDPATIDLYAGAAADRALLESMEAAGVAHVFIAGFPTDIDSARRWLDDVAATALAR